MNWVQQTMTQTKLDEYLKTALCSQKTKKNDNITEKELLLGVSEWIAGKKPKHMHA